MHFSFLSWASNYPFCQFRCQCLGGCEFRSHESESIQNPQPVARSKPRRRPKKQWQIRYKMRDPLPVYPFLTLPRDILVAIFEILDDCTSTCFGLSCSSLYSMHRGLHSTYPMILNLGTEGANNKGPAVLYPLLSRAFSI